MAGIDVREIYRRGWSPYGIEAVHSFRGVVLGLLVVICGFSAASASDDDDEPSDTKPKRPNVYLDYNTQYTTVPPNTLAIGFRNFVSQIPASAQVVTLNAPLTVDLNDRISVYGGFSASTSRTDFTSWSSMTFDSWNVGFNADVIQENGAIPSVTVISTLTRSITSAP